MPATSNATALFDWVTSVAAELGIEDAVDPDSIVDTVLDMTADVAQTVSRPSAPVTAYLLGIAAGRSTDPKAAARELATKVTALSGGWRKAEAG
ncbi:hypothetical protein SAMN05443637_1217 [Pseudonocardia thermophila]|jgi:hypothetical protein|uniref:DUF6457 domain-containing protein n=1 Tax=Pseudonocardia thermophila TaxID=1848 RepID=A0A1M6YR11_PSETH|nr:DUF6457 domain-containing protein [Pseudonocardia thermophila]SHL20688.1 hypothetical protein SAMN05443637_1217 [Pseudonocardia thermophila]